VNELTSGWRSAPLAVLLGILFTWTGSASAGDTSFTVTNNGASAYTINGVDNPVLQLVRGQTYSFSISSSGHPFFIKTAQVTGTGSTYDDGVIGNGTQNGVLTFTVPLTAPDTLFYICQFHSPMTGTLQIVDEVELFADRFESQTRTSR